VLRVSVGGKRYYVKRYSGTGKNPRRRWFGLRRWLGPPRVRAEWQNLLAFRPGEFRPQPWSPMAWNAAWRLHPRRAGDRGNPDTRDLA
jgi:hypothetical protein